MSWIRVTHAANIPPREGRAVQIGSEEIAIFNLGDSFLAVGNRCPHRGGPLADGIVAGDHVVCPLHSWKVCLTSGTVSRPAGEAGCTPTYPIQVVDGIVLVQVAEQRAEAA